MDNKLNLGEIFSFPEKKDWIELAAKENKLPDPLNSLSFTHSNGITQLPYYDGADVAENLLNLSPDHNSVYGPRTWFNMPLIEVSTEKEANKLALEALSAGADGILFRIEKSGMDLNQILKNIELPYCQVSWIIRDNTYVENLRKISGLQGYVFWHSLPESLPGIIENSTGSLKFGGIVLEQQEHTVMIAEALKKIYHQLKIFLKAGQSTSVAAKHLACIVPLSEDFFADICSLRALRFLFFQIMQHERATDIQPEHLFIHAVSHSWKSDAIEPHSNMLKATTAAIAGITAGCNAISIEPENKLDLMQRRIARNVSSILREESHLNKVADPLAGAYMIEKLSSQFAELAWEKFQDNLS